MFPERGEFIQIILDEAAQCGIHHLSTVDTIDKTLVNSMAQINIYADKQRVGRLASRLVFLDFVDKAFPDVSTVRPLGSCLDVGRLIVLGRLVFMLCRLNLRRIRLDRKSTRLNSSHWS